MPTIKNKFFRFIKSEQLYNRKPFHLLLTLSTILAVTVWWSVYSSVQQNIDSRLENEVSRVESSIRARLSIYENSLRFLRVFFQLGDERAFQSYQELIQAADIQNRYPGVRGVGVAALVKQKDIQYHTARQRLIHKKYQLQPEGKRPEYGPVVAFEPMSEYPESNFGRDILIDSLKAQAIERAIQSSNVEISEPVSFSSNYKNFGSSGFLMVLPFYNSNKVPETVNLRKKKAIGVLYMPLRPKMFFEGLMGKPNENESVNFEISSADSSSLESVIYRRFQEESMEGRNIKTKIIEVNGAKWKLRVTPFPRFYSFSDKYTPLIIAAIEVILISLVMIVFRLMFNQLINEKTAKDLMREAERNSQIHTKQLRSLNSMSQQISAELEVDKMADQFFKSVTSLSEASHSLLYLQSRIDGPSEQLAATNFNSLWSAHVRRNLVQAKDVGALFENKGVMIRKSSESSQIIYDYFFTMPDKFIDWVFVLVPSREQGISALFFMAKESGAGFTENTLEIVDSFISQFATSIENANLLKRTEDSNKAKSQFLANMSHEIRTPLNAIIGFSEMSLKEDVGAKKQDLIEGIRKNGQQLTRLIDDILDISKVEAGKLQIVKKAVSLKTLLKEVNTVMEDRAQAKGIQFQVEWEHNVPLYIETDEVRLKQIIFNVVGNAIKFTERGKVLLSISAEDSDTGKQIKFLVKDSGIGISAKDQVKLFRPFQQGDSSSTRRFGGTGLGLALSKKLAAELGGDLFLSYSQVDKGSEFCIRIHAGHLTGNSLLTEVGDSPKKLTNYKEKSTGASLKSKHILIVEDSEDNQEIFEYFLQSAGAITETVADGLTAVNRAQVHSFDLILMDIQLPSIDGKEATRRIRQNGFRNPIVALTAHAMPEEKASCLEAGCDGQISKPVSGESLVKQVSEFLMDQESLDPSKEGKLS